MTAEETLIGLGGSCTEISATLEDYGETEVQRDAKMEIQGYCQEIAGKL
jgi:hypothetical protein